MKQIILTFGLILCGSVLFGQSPRIRLNQITKDSLTGSVVLSGSDSNMVYSRNFFLNLTDSVLILFGDTLSTTATAFTGVATDLTLTGNGTVGNELKVDTAVIATVSALADSLAGIISSVTTDLTLTGDGSVATPLKVDTAVIATIRALSDSVATRGTVSSVAVSAGTGISVSGSPITTSGTITITNSAPDQTVALTGGTGITTSGTYPNFTINNSAPDQTVSITGAGINAITGTYPNFTITGTEVDGSTTNELQTISTTGAAGNITLSNGGGTLNLNVNDADASATNEGSLTVGAGGANSSDIVSNTSGSTNVTIAGGSNVTVTESGSTITIASTAGGTGTVTNITAGTFLSGGTITTSGTIALDTASAGLKTYIGENIGTVNLASEVTGTLPVANGGTGATTLTSGAFLKGNGTSAVSGSSNLSETADTVYVSKFLNVDTATFYVDAINNKVGVGMTAPTAKLEINGDSRINGTLNLNTSKLADNFILNAYYDGNASMVNLFEHGLNKTVDFGFYNKQSTIRDYGGSFTLNADGTFSITHRISNTDTEVIKINNSNNIFMSTVYDDDLQGSTTRDLVIKNDGQLGYLSSTRNAKINIEPLQNIDWIYNLNPVTYNYRKKDEKGLFTDEFFPEKEIGLLAEETALYADHLIYYDIDKDGSKKMVGLGYSKLITPILKAVQIQKQIIESQKAEIEQLKTQYNDLLQRIINLENK